MSSRTKSELAAAAKSDCGKRRPSTTIAGASTTVTTLASPTSTALQATASTTMEPQHDDHDGDHKATTRRPPTRGRARQRQPLHAVLCRFAIVPFRHRGYGATQSGRRPRKPTSSCTAVRQAQREPQVRTSAGSGRAAGEVVFWQCDHGSGIRGRSQPHRHVDG